ncbi:MAG TPA: carboxymuconolactone decarboxylase family protein [Pirellulales bacterium]|jgi:AhpD family alkylhydroperoxidase|nr:carboxymuconolactone decarboxylase family protein [Pirellulales bacterium]
MRITIDSAQVAKTFAKFKENPSFQESAQLFARGRPVLEMLQAMAMNENVLRAFSGLESIYPNGTLERGILEKVILRVSQLHECQFCVNSHLDIMRSLGMSDDLTAAGLHSQRERLAVEYAELVTRDSNRIPDDFFARLAESFNEPQIVELTFLIGLITMLNRFNNALDVRYNGEMTSVAVQ